jgi:hypothetical protein
MAFHRVVSCATSVERKPPPASPPAVHADQILNQIVLNQIDRDTSDCSKEPEYKLCRLWRVNGVVSTTYEAASTCASSVRQGGGEVDDKRSSASHSAPYASLLLGDPGSTMVGDSVGENVGAAVDVLH